MCEFVTMFQVILSLSPRLGNYYVIANALKGPNCDWVWFGRLADC